MMSLADAALVSVVATAVVATAVVAIALVATTLVATVLVAIAVVVTTTHLLAEFHRTAYRDSMSGIRTSLSDGRTDRVFVQNCREQNARCPKAPKALELDAIATRTARLERQPVARARSPCGALESRTGVTTPAQELVITVASQLKASY